MSTALAHIDSVIGHYPAKPLWVTEASINDRPQVISDEQYAAQYYDFWQHLKRRLTVQGVTYFVASASNSYFNPECWIVDRQSRGIASGIRAIE